MLFHYVNYPREPTNKGWGEIPARDIFARLSTFDGIITLEMRSRYSAYYSEALNNVRSLIYGDGNV